jgi:hypothetical protein
MQLAGISLFCNGHEVALAPKIHIRQELALDAAGCRLPIMNNTCDKLLNCAVSHTCQLHVSGQRQSKGQGGKEKSDN